MKSTTQTPDKLALWAEVCDIVEIQKQTDLAYILRNSAYLDSLEQNLAIVGVKSWNILELLGRRNARLTLEGIFSTIEGKEITVKLAHGRPRIVQQKGTSKQWGTETLTELHSQYGDIMSIVNRHPAFVKATKSFANGGWGIFPEILTDACRDYGADVILKGLLDIAKDAGVVRPRACFLENLKAGVYGHKLAYGANAIGPIGVQPRELLV